MHRKSRFRQQIGSLTTADTDICVLTCPYSTISGPPKPLFLNTLYIYMDSVILVGMRFHIEISKLVHKVVVDGLKSRESLDDSSLQMQSMKTVKI
jgi:hypothetical protein